MNNCSIFVSSADSYSDLWPVFFDLFKRYWPEYDGEIYLNTENKTYTHPSLNIICTQVGKQKSFGITFRKGLDTIPTDNVLLIMIDYIFMGKVNSIKIKEYFDFFINKDLDSLCLTHQGYPNIEQTNNVELVRVHAPAPFIMFSYQIAFWKKAMLYQMALPHENPWSSEWFGTKRAEKMKIKLAAISDDKYNPTPYNLAGCLHKGKWLVDAIEHLNSIDYSFDFKNRGLFQEPKRTIKTRLKLRWMLVKDGLKGSYCDLWFR
jgi:hypothetical protein